jgi:hypothetical protein
MENSSTAPGAPCNPGGAERESFVEQTCLPFLREKQNTDGGWAFQPGNQSRVEPTAWALLALQEFASSTATQDAIDRGLLFLVKAQLENGGWAAVSGRSEACWVTSLACWALRPNKEHARSLIRGLRWLNEDRPRDSGFGWRMAQKLTGMIGRNRISSQSPSFSGWGWTPHTASWVEPTCYAMIVQRGEAASPLSNLRRRYKLAEAMLYDRMCPGGGWNCGNPRVYGVAGQPQVGPTVWALVALREHSQRAENRKSLDWLETNQDTVGSPESLALAHIGLGAYGRCNSALAENLYGLYESATLPWSVQAVSWAALAFSQSSKWLNVVSGPSS